MVRGRQLSASSSAGIVDRPREAPLKACPKLTGEYAPPKFRNRNFSSSTPVLQMMFDLNNSLSSSSPQFCMFRSLFAPMPFIFFSPLYAMKHLSLSRAKNRAFHSSFVIFILLATTLVVSILATALVVFTLFPTILSIAVVIFLNFHPVVRPAGRNSWDPGMGRDGHTSAVSHF
ncbi:hypothetical protein MIND_01131900 [Mycena indigotica]|uniref:Uncharacterized protein n=1 Tax=Mycena indigotica TaxID=2126181 RepID=A0A8H6S7C9_9AGAR|nr:uncharacterized protein MIND_01131900 [Mycena indigotica]KAF7293535.1 hypothetical protein MIND_01131900 [Mycena indigotica]